MLNAILMSLNDPRWGNQGGNGNKGGNNQGPLTLKTFGAISTVVFPACSEASPAMVAATTGHR